MTAIVRLKVTLADVEPQVLRRIDVPVTIRLDRLHLVLQAALGWTNSHLWEIRASDTGWGPQFEDNWGDGPLDAAKARLVDVLEDTGVKTLHYLYDFGDSWDHTIKVERFLDPVPGLDYPVLVEVRGRCPPEDIGGPPGYEQLLEALAGPKHPDRAELMQWHGEAFDPHDVDTAALDKAVRALAGKPTRKARAKPARKGKSSS